MKGLTEKDIMDLAWSQMSFLDIITLDKEQKSKLSDILKILQDSLNREKKIRAYDHNA